MIQEILTAMKDKNNEKKDIKTKFTEFCKELEITPMEEKDYKYKLSLNEKGNVVGFKGRMTLTYDKLRKLGDEIFGCRVLYKLNDMNEVKLCKIQEAVKNEISINKLTDLKELYDIKEHFIRDLVDQENTINRYINYEVIDNNDKIPQFTISNFVDYVKTLLINENFQIINVDTIYYAAFKFERLYKEILEYVDKYKDLINKVDGVRYFYAITKNYRDICYAYGKIFLNVLENYTEERIFKENDGDTRTLYNIDMYNLRANDYEIRFNCRDTNNSLFITYIGDDYYFRFCEHTTYNFNTTDVSEFTKFINVL